MSSYALPLKNLTCNIKYYKINIFLSSLALLYEARYIDYTDMMEGGEAIREQVAGKCAKI